MNMLIECRVRRSVLYDLLQIPDMTCNLFSVSTATQKEMK